MTPLNIFEYFCWAFLGFIPIFFSYISAMDGISVFAFILAIIFQVFFGIVAFHVGLGK
jgi:hypothetical protein